MKICVPAQAGKSIYNKKRHQSRASFDTHQDLHLDLSNTSSQSNIAGSSNGTSNSISIESRHHGGISTSEGARGTESINKAVVLQVGLASSVSTGAWAGKKLSNILQERGLDVLENVAFSDNTGAGGTDVEGVAGVVVPHVVNGVNECCSADLWGAARCVVNVVAGEGDEVCGAGEVDGPVVTVVTGGGPASVTIEFGVGDGDSTGGISACNELYRVLVVILRMGMRSNLPFDDRSRRS